MGNPKIRCLQQFDLCLIADGTNLPKNALSIFVEAGIEKTSYVLEHHRSRRNLPKEPDCLRKEIPLVVLSQLLPSHRKRRTGHPSCQKVNPLVRNPVEVVNVAADDIPIGAVRSERLTISFFELNEGAVLKPCHGKTEGLATRSRTYLHACQLAHYRLLTTTTKQAYQWYWTP